MDESPGDPDSASTELIDEDCVRLGHQIFHYAKADNRRTASFKRGVCGLAAYVVSYYKQPVGYEPPFSENSDSGMRTRGNFTGSASLGYPQEWAVDTKKAKDAVRAFTAGTVELQKDKKCKNFVKDFQRFEQLGEIRVDKGKKKFQDPFKGFFDNTNDDHIQDPSGQHLQNANLRNQLVDPLRSTEFISRGSSLQSQNPTLPSNQTICEEMWDLNLNLSEIATVRALLKKTRQDVIIAIRNEMLAITPPQIQQDNADHTDVFHKPWKRNNQHCKSKEHTQQLDKDHPSDNDDFDDSDSFHRSPRKRDNQHKHQNQALDNNNSDFDSWNRQENKRFHLKKVSLFNPFLVVKDSKDNGEIVNFERKTYYWSVHLFINTFKDIDDFKKEGIVRKNLNKCLRGAAQE